MTYFKRYLTLLLSAVLLLASVLLTRLPKARAAVVPDASKDGNIRVLLTSDIHYCTSAYYGVAGKDRLQLWVDSVNAEHQRAPLDLIIVAGDMSLDHFYSNGNIAGSYMGTNKVSYTENFVKEYVSQLPAGVPVRFIAGNHEQYNNTQWKAYTGNDRQCSVRVEGNLFILLDNYNSFLEPNVTENSVYTPSDMNFIQSEMAKYPDDKVWLVAHYFDASRESEEFKRLVRENDRIMGLFGGHDHMGDVKTNTANTNAWGNKPYTMCGTYALSGTVTAEHSAGQPQRFGYEAKELTAAQQESLDLTLANFWGFRELVITPTSATSNYISVATGSTAPYFYGRKISLSRTTKYSATYATVSATADWGPAADGIYYIGSSADMKAFSALGQTFNFAGKTVKLTRDIDMTGVDFTMIPQFAGTLDGCGHAVKNLSMYATSGTLAMIDQLSGATIQNLRMVDGTVKLVDSHSAAGIAVRAKGTCLFHNVYCKMNISVDSDCYRAGGFLAFPEVADITFDSCVSECTVSGMRGGGFVAQVNYNNGSLTLRDCAFIGDLSGAGKWSGGIIGLCAGNVTMERCVSLGKQSANTESGGLLFIDHQNQSETATTAVYLKDCYAAVDTQVPVGTQATRSFRLKFTMEYTGKTPLTINTSSTNLLASHQSTIQSNFGYLAKGSTVNLTTSNLKTLCPTLTAWSSVGGTVTYGTSKTVPKILPTTVWNLMNGKSITATPSSVCSLCGGNAKIPENLGNGTHVIACDRMTHSIDTHSYVNGKCTCGQWETPYLLLDFLPLSEANEASDWIATDRDTGVVTFTVNNDNKGTMEATAKYRDAYVSMANAMEKEYLIKTGDVIEVRLKGTIETGSCPRTTVYFITDQQTSYAETHQLTHAMVFGGNYETVTLGTLDAYVGQSIQKLRIDVFQNASTDFQGTYSLDYIYVGPADYAPSKASSALYFDFSDDEYSAQRYGTSTYRGYNYDVTDSWRRGETGEHPVVANGKLSFAITERYNASNEPVHITAIEPVGTNKTFSWGNDCKYANDLSYDPAKAEVMQIRLRLTDVQHYYPNNTKQYLRLFYLPEGATEWSCGTAPNDWAESILIAIEDQYLDGGEKEGEFFTLTLSLKGKKFSTYESIRGIMLNFMGMRGGRVEIDYLYIGPATAENLLFDFEGTGEERYDNISYGMMDYDTTAHWFHEADVAELSISGGELRVSTASSVKNDNTQYAETSKTDARKVDPLHYTPEAGDIVQFKYRLENYNEDLNTGKTASITVYGWDSSDNATYQGTPWVAVDTGKVGTNVTVTKDVPANWKSFDVTRIRMTFRGLIGSKIAVDYLYVGSGCNAPTPVHTYAYKVTKSPTTSAAGVLTGTCTGCSATTTVTLPKLTAADYDKTTTKAPTCTATGIDKYTWKTTTYGSFYFNVTIAAKGHTEVIDKAVAATCTATGLTEGKHCSVCNEVLTAQTTVAAKGHVEVIDKAVAATCTATGLTEGKYCAVCDQVLIKQEIVSATGHALSYARKDEKYHVVTCTNCGKTAEAVHSYFDGLCVCGQAEVKEPVQNAAWKMGHTLNLASDISVNLAVSKSLLAGYDMETVYVLAEIDTYEGNEKTDTKVIKIEPVEQGSYYYFTLTGLTAVHMNDRIHSVLYGTKDGQVYFSAMDDYSIADYAYSQMNKANMPVSLKVLCADLLRYGAKAQIFKAYRTDNLAYAAMTEAHKAFLSDMETVTFGNTNVTLNDLPGASVAWAGKALDLNSKVTLKFIFNPTNYKGSIEDLTLRLTFTAINGETKTVILENAELYNAERNYYAFSFDGLLAAELRTVVSAQVYAGNTPVSATLQYSADTYGNNKTGTLLDLCKALFAYSDSAKTYFAG